MVAGDWWALGSKEVEVAASIGVAAFVKVGVEVVGDPVSTVLGQIFKSWGISVEPRGACGQKKESSSAIVPMP